MEQYEKAGVNRYKIISSKVNVEDWNMIIVGKKKAKNT